MSTSRYTPRQSYIGRTLGAAVLVLALSLVAAQFVYATGPLTKTPVITRGEAAKFTRIAAVYHCRAIIRHMLAYGGGAAACKHASIKWMKDNCHLRILQRTWCSRIFGIKFHDVGYVHWYTCDFVLWKKFHAPTVWELKGKCHSGFRNQRVPAPR